MKTELLKLSNKRHTVILTIAITVFYSCRQIPIKNYYIPKDFAGNVAIIYNGNLQKKSNKSIYNYVIPDSGILYVNELFKSGNYKINFYQKNQIAKFDTLFEELPSTKIDTNKNRIYFNRVLTFNKQGRNIYVTTFYVGKAKGSELGKDRFLFEQSLERIIFQ